MLARCSRKSMDSSLDRTAALNWLAIADTVVAVDRVVAAGTVVVATAVRRLVVDRVAVVAVVVANRKSGRTIEVVSTGKQAPDVYG